MCSFQPFLHIGDKRSAAAAHIGDYGVEISI